MTSVLPSTRRFLIATVVLTSCIGCDQASKSFATQSLKDIPPVTMFAGTLRFEYALNPGGFLSLGSSLPPEVRPWFFVGFNVCLMAVIFGFLFFRKNVNPKMFVAVLFILAGGIGNLIDRLTNDGFVTDFINVGIGPLRTGIFNVADMAVMFGGLAVFLLTLSEPDEARPQPITVEEPQ